MNIENYTTGYYSIEKRVYHRSGRNAGFNTRVVRYIIVRYVSGIGWVALTDVRGIERRFKTPKAAAAAAKAWFAAQGVSV